MRSKFLTAGSSIRAPINSKNGPKTFPEHGGSLDDLGWRGRLILLNRPTRELFLQIRQFTGVRRHGGVDMVDHLCDDRFRFFGICGQQQRGFK